MTNGVVMHGYALLPVRDVNEGWLPVIIAGDGTNESKTKYATADSCIVWEFFVALGQIADSERWRDLARSGNLNSPSSTKTWATSREPWLDPETHVGD
jgi:hypothetical protein